MIVKCQRSLSTTERARQMLFYDRDRTHMWMGDLTPEWDKLFGVGETRETNRFFAEVTWEKDAPPVFVRRLPEQDWSLYSE